MANKIQQEQTLREHLIKMLMACGYTGPVTKFNNEELRELLEEYKLIFLRRLQAAPE